MSDLRNIGTALEALLRAGEILEDMPERLDAAVRAAERSARATAMIHAVQDGLHPDRDYLPKHASQFLGMQRKSYNAIPQALLPRRKGGYARGVDLMAYRGDITHEEAKAYKEAQRETVLRVISNNDTAS